MFANRITRAAALTTAATATLLVTATGSALAGTAPDHHTVVCQSASFYRHYEVGSGPFELIRTLSAGNDVGHTFGVQGEHNGWGYTQDFGPNDWGWMQLNCMG